MVQFSVQYLQSKPAGNRQAFHVAVFGQNFFSRKPQFWFLNAFN